MVREQLARRTPACAQYPSYRPRPPPRTLGLGADRTAGADRPTDIELLGRETDPPEGNDGAGRDTEPLGLEGAAIGGL